MRRAFAVGVAASLLWYPTTSTAEYDVLSTSAISSSGAPGSSLSSAGLPLVNTASLPDQLPEPVAQQEQNAALIRTPISRASAVRIGEYSWLSAGHLLRNGKGELIPALKACGTIAIHSQPYFDGNEEIDEGDLYAIQQISEFGTEKNPADNTVPDIALLQTQVNITFHGTKLAKRTPKIGDPLFAINYQPTEAGEIRTPDKTRLTPDQIRRGLGKPAIFGVLVVGFLPNGDIVTIDNLKSYGAINDATGREGESGGGFYNSAGELVGLSSLAVLATEGETPAQVKKDYNVDVYGLEPPAKVGLSIIQPTSPRLLQTLQNQLGSAPFCEIPSR